MMDQFFNRPTWGALTPTAGMPPVGIPQPAPAWIPGWSWVCLDIETDAPPESEIQRELALWKPSGNARKEETIEKQRAEAETKIRERGALLDSAPVACIALITALGNPWVLHTLKPSRQPANCLESGFESEREMLVQLRAALNSQCTPDTTLIGFNLIGFDLPKLRFAFVRNSLKLPFCLSPQADQPTCDVMRLWRAYTTKDGPFFSLTEVAQRLGLLDGPKAMSGAEVPRAIAEGRHAEILEYCADDARMTAAAWQRLTSQVGG